MPKPEGSKERIRRPDEWFAVDANIDQSKKVQSLPSNHHRWYLVLVWANARKQKPQRGLWASFEHLVTCMKGIVPRDHLQVLLENGNLEALDDGRIYAHDWHEWQDVFRDPSGAERQRRLRQRRRLEGTGGALQREPNEQGKGGGRQQELQAADPVTEKPLSGLGRPDASGDDRDLVVDSGDTTQGSVPAGQESGNSPPLTQLDPHPPLSNLVPSEPQPSSSTTNSSMPWLKGPADLKKKLQNHLDSAGRALQETPLEDLHSLDRNVTSDPSVTLHIPETPPLTPPTQGGGYRCSVRCVLHPYTDLPPKGDNELQDTVTLRNAPIESRDQISNPQTPFQGADGSNRNPQDQDQIRNVTPTPWLLRKKTQEAINLLKEKLPEGQLPGVIKFLSKRKPDPDALLLAVDRLANHPETIANPIGYLVRVLESANAEVHASRHQYERGDGGLQTAGDLMKQLFGRIQPGGNSTEDSNSS